MEGREEGLLLWQDTAPTPEGCKSLLEPRLERVEGLPLVAHRKDATWAPAEGQAEFSHSLPCVVGS